MDLTVEVDRLQMQLRLASRLLQSASTVLGHLVMDTPKDQALTERAVALYERASKAALSASGGIIMDLATFLLARITEDEAVDAQMRRWGPSRVLAECSAKRRIVALHSRTADGGCAVCDSEDVFERQLHAGRLRPGEYLAGERAPAPWPCDTIKILASVYAEHEDYNVAVSE